jgi:hypothetical protein
MTNERNAPMNNTPFPATGSEALPGIAPTAKPAPTATRAGQSVAKCTETAQREPCAFCGDQRWTEARFALGRLVCSLCFEGRKPATSMVPNPNECRQIDLWLKPQTPNKRIAT